MRTPSPSPQARAIRTARCLKALVCASVGLILETGVAAANFNDVAGVGVGVGGVGNNEGNDRNEYKAKRIKTGKEEQIRHKDSNKSSGNIKTERQDVGKEKNHRTT